MTLEQHLQDLRKTVIAVALILIVSFFVTYSYGDQLSLILLRPLQTALGEGQGGKVVYLGIFDKMMSQIQVSFWASILLSSPFWFYAIWRFIGPGLYPHEAKAVKPFIVVGFLLFALGVCFGYFLVFPLIFKTLLEFGVPGVEATIGLKDYLIIACKVLVFLGFIFQVPNVMLILGFMGLVTKYSLRDKRRYIYVLLSIMAAILTPPDVISMMALLVPLIVLFEIGLWAVALIVHPYLERQNAR